MESLPTMDKPPKLMYRPPRRNEYLNIAEALDELFNRLDAIESKLNREVNNES